MEEDQEEYKQKENKFKKEQQLHKKQLGNAVP